MGDGQGGRGGGGRSGGLQGLNSSLSPHHTHTSRAALNTLSGQVHPVHPPLGFRGGYDWGPGRSFWTTARFASTLPKVFFSSSMPHPTQGPPPQKVPYLGTQGGCRAPPGWPLLCKTCPRGRGRAGNGCAGLGPLQGRGSSGSRQTREPRVSSRAPLQGKRWEAEWGPARRGWLGATGVRSEKLQGQEKGS